MDDLIRYVVAQVDKIDSRLDGMDKTLAVNTAVLDEHVKRTNLLEAEVNKVRKHVDLVNFIAKAAAWTLGAAASIIGILAALHLL